MSRRLSRAAGLGAPARIPTLGVIEGFYGRAWPHSSRLQMLPWLRQLGFRAYLYAPKADASLRKRWLDPWSREQLAALAELARAAAHNELEFVVGLSPFALYRAYHGRARNTLRERVQSIADSGARGLALLFDDMPGALSGLAERQAQIANDVAGWAPQLKLRLCPTYYSDDPILDRVFGERPARYLEDLSERLAADTEMFWTGPEVCSDTIDTEHLARVSARRGGPLALWDNYPVNDSRSRSEHLYVGDLVGRSAAGAEFLASHWCNAMNQAALSLPALASLPALYGMQTADSPRVLAAAGLSPRLIDACRPLSRQARGALSAAQRAELVTLAPQHSLAARELKDWLQGVYRFDPACLTD